MMRPHLNRKLILETAEKVNDGAGGFNESWIEIGSLWAEVKLGRGREREREAVGTARVDYRIVVRADPPGSELRPFAGQRFRDGTRLFRILAVAELDLAGRYLRCFASEEVAT